MIATAYEIQGDIVRDQNHQKWLYNITQRPRSDQIVSDLKADEAYSVDIQDLTVKMGHRVNLSISKLNIRAGEIIRECTEGSEFKWVTIIFSIPQVSKVLAPSFWCRY